MYKLYMNAKKTNIKVSYNGKEKYRLVVSKTSYFKLYFKDLIYEIGNHSWLIHKFILYKEGLSFLTFKYRSFLNPQKNFSLSYKGGENVFRFNETKSIIKSNFFILIPKKDYYELTINEENELESIFVTMCYFLTNSICDIYAD